MYKKKWNVLSLIKDEELKNKVKNIKFNEKLIFLHGDQENQEQRDAVWIKFLAALHQKIPIVLLGADSTKEYEAYARKTCESLEVFNDTALILFTSGSTGKPKPIQRTLSVLLLETIRNVHVPITEKMIMADFRGVNNSGVNYFIRALSTGTKFVYIDSRKDYHTIVQEMIDKKVDYLAASAMQWHGITRALQAGKFKWNLKVAISSAGAIDDESLKILLAISDCRAYCVYGMTELGMVTFLDSKMILLKRGSVGKPFSQVKVDILDEKGEKCDPYMEGEIVITSELLSPSIKNPHHTGDNGYLDEDGYLYLTGRKGDVLKIKGRRVNVMQIENAYKRYRSVVFGVQVPIMGGHEGVIVVETNDSLRKVCEYIEKTAPPVSEVCRPRWIFVSKKLPRTSTGKFDRTYIKNKYTKKIEEKKNNKNLIKGDIYKNDFEVKLIDVWEKVLNMRGVTRNDDFFKLGGKSLRVMSTISMIKRVFGVDLKPSDISKNPTIKSLAKKITALQK